MLSITAATVVQRRLICNPHQTFLHPLVYFGDAAGRMSVSAVHTQELWMYSTHDNHIVALCWHGVEFFPSVKLQHSHMYW